MGEWADLLLDGILDASGEYTGKNYGYPVYPKGWFGKDKKQKTNHGRADQINNFLNQRGIEKDTQKLIIEAYGAKVGREKLTGYIIEHWKDFKSFVDENIGFVKPSKRQ